MQAPRDGSKPRAPARAGYARRPRVGVPLLKDHGLLRQRGRLRRRGKGSGEATEVEPHETRSYEVGHVNALWHYDFHGGRRQVLTVSGVTPSASGPSASPRPRPGLSASVAGFGAASPCVCRLRSRPGGRSADVASEPPLQRVFAWLSWIDRVSPPEPP
jgi:hypothetical protein